MRLRIGNAPERPAGPFAGEELEADVAAEEGGPVGTCAVMTLFVEAGDAEAACEMGVGGVMVDAGVDASDGGEEGGMEEVSLEEAGWDPEDSGEADMRRSRSVKSV